MAKRVLKRQAGLNATFYDDKTWMRATSIFGKGGIRLAFIFVLYVTNLMLLCVLLKLLRKLYDMFSI